MENTIYKLHQDILELETENMSPILEAIGIEHNPKMLLDGLKKPQEIITIYRNNTLVALLRYSIIEGSVAKVWSIQVKDPKVNKILLLPLIKKALKSFRRNKIDKLVSVVQKSNTASIRFHEKLGFKVVKEFEKSIRFEGKLHLLNWK